MPKPKSGTYIYNTGTDKIYHGDLKPMATGTAHQRLVKKHGLEKRQDGGHLRGFGVNKHGVIHDRSGTLNPHADRTAEKSVTKKFTAKLTK